MISPYWSYVLLAVVVLLVGLLVLLYLVLKKARKTHKEAEAAPAVVVKTGEAAPAEFVQYGSAMNLGLRASFSRAMRLLKTHVTGRDYRYRVPWFLMIGETKSGKTTLLANTGLNLPIGEQGEEAQGTKQGINWCFFDKGVVLDVAGDYVLREDGETSNNRGWNTITRLLQKYRSERPIDGVILTIPCTDLVGPQTLSAERRVKLEHKAASIYKKLWQTQKMLGMSFPVYILVTKCDQITGFKSLCNEIPPHLRDDIFGWSSPYTLETAYNPSWVQEAFQNIYRYLFQIQIELFADRNEVQDSDGLFVLPTEMQTLRAPLQVYLDRIFKESSYHDSFFFRGLYFCGDGGAEATVPTTAQPLLIGDADESMDDWLINSPDPFEAPLAVEPPPTDRRPVFLKHLFERKIFQEDLLAQPVSRIVLSRNRTVLVAQALSLAIPLIGGLGLLATYGGLKQQEAELNEFLTTEAQDLSRVREKYGNKLLTESYGGMLTSPRVNKQTRVATYAPASFDETTLNQSTYDADEPRLSDGLDAEENLLDAMTKVSGKKFYSVFIPSSWFSRINERIEQSFIAAFKYVILESIRLGLEERTDELLVAGPVYERNLIPGINSPRLSTSGIVYNHPKKTPRPEPSIEPPVAPVTTVPSFELRAFIENLNQLIINRARYDRIRQRDTGSFDDLSRVVEYLGHAPLPQNFDRNNELFLQALKNVEGRPLASTDIHRRAALKVSEIIEGLYQSSFESRSVTYTYLDDITQTETLLARPEYTWLATYVFNPRSPFHDMTLASGLRELRKSLEGLSRERFMARGGAYTSTRQQLMSRRLIWDKDSLRQAIALYKEYEGFIENRAYNHSDDLDYSVRQAALNQLKVKINALIVQAQKYQPAQAVAGESILKSSIISEVRSFEEAQDLLAQLMEISERLGIGGGLRQAVIEQAAYLIRSIGREFMSESFYAVKQGGFAWWNGSKPVSYVAFDIASPEDLIAYLAIQRKRIAFLARELAAPIFAFMATQNVSPQVLQGDSPVNWEEILDELNKYDNKVPGNSVAALESFIRFEMDRVNLEDCAEMIRKSGGQSGDFFIRIRNNLRRQLYQRCEQLAEVKVVNENLNALASYVEIEQAFNHSLAGRFPFAEPGNNPDFLEADPETVIAFFELLDRKEAGAREALKMNPKLGPYQERALQFLDRMDEVRAFFSSFLEKKKPPAFDFDFRFRTNEGKEIGAQQIIDWNLDVGKKRFHYLDEERNGVWLFGEPIRLTLRWANDSPSIPVPTSRVKVRERTAILEFNNRWSLLYLLIRHAGSTADFEPQGIDVEPYTLKFMIRTKPDATPSPLVRRAQPEELTTELTRVYMRVGLLAPGKKEPLTLPVFPQAAPKLPSAFMIIKD